MAAVNSEVLRDLVTVWRQEADGMTANSNVQATRRAELYSFSSDRGRSDMNAIAFMRGVVGAIVLIIALIFGATLAGASVPSQSMPQPTSTGWEPCGQILHQAGTPSPCYFRYGDHGAFIFIGGHWYPTGSSAANSAAVRHGIPPLDTYQL